MSNEYQAAARQHAREDNRLYVPHCEGWNAKIKHDASKEYCYFQEPGEETFHLLVRGEIFLQLADEKYCLNCALRHGVVTRDRMHWQHGASRGGSPI